MALRINNLDQCEGFNNFKPFIEFLDLIILNEKPAKIILFGSLAKGDYNQKSDIDLFILFYEKIVFKNKQSELKKYIKKNEKLFDLFPYHIHDFLTLSKNPDLFIFNALKNSKVIYERE